MNDPYAGLGKPVPAEADPYAGLGKPVPAEADPYAGLGKPFIEQSLTSKAGDAGKLAVRGATSEGFYYGMEGLSRLAAGIDRDADVERAKGPEYTGLARTLGELERAEYLGPNAKRQEQIKQISGRMQQLNTAAAPAAEQIRARKPDDTLLGWYAGAVKDTRDRIKQGLPVAPESEQALWGQISQGVGQAIGTLPTYAIPGFGPASAVGQLYQGGYEDAKEHGADEATAHDAGVKNVPASALEYLSDKLIIGKVLKPLKGKLTVRELLKSLGISAGSEGITEGAQQAWQNYVASSLSGFNPDRKLDDGVINAAVVGAAVGGLVGGGGPLLAEGTRRFDELDTGKNKPERPQDLKAQQQQLLKNERAVQMYPTGTDPLPLPKGMQSIKNDRGVFHFNPAKIGAAEILELSEQGRENELLGLGPFSKPEIERRAAQGEPVAATTAALEKGKSAGSTVKLEPLKETLQRRDLDNDIEASLPDTESKDHVAKRSAEDLKRLADQQVDYPALWRATVDTVLAAGVTPKQFSALENMLGMLADKEGRKKAGLRAKLTTDRLDNLLGDTVLAELRGPQFARLRDALAKKPEHMQALLAEFQRARTAEPVPAENQSTPPPAPSPEVANTTPEPSTGPVAGKTQGEPVAQDARARLRAQIEEETKAETAKRAEIERKKAVAEAALKEASEKREAESARLKAIDQTGRDPDSGLIADLRKVPSAELENFDWEKDRYQHGGKEVKTEDIEAILLQRAQAEERQEANQSDYTLGDLLKGKRGALKAAGITKPLRLLTPKEAKAQGKLGGEHARLRERTGGFAFFSKDGLAEDYLRQKLEELGFDVPDTNAAYALIERAMGGEEIHPTRRGGQAQFGRRKQVPLKDDQGALFDGEEMPFNLDGGEAKDHSGSTDAEEARRAAKKQAEQDQGALFRRHSKDNPELAAIEAKMVRGGLDRDQAARAVNAWIDAADGKPKWPWRNGRPVELTEDEARALDRAVKGYDAGETFAWPDEALRNRVKSNFSRRAAVSIEALAERWGKNLQAIAPGLAKEAELRFGSALDLVEEGVARRDELTGEEEAARVRNVKARKEIFYLFELALRRNTPDLTRINLQHEMGHAFWDTLDRSTQRALEKLFAQEVETKTGPLYDAEGNLRENVALGATEDVQEWFAERLAHANDRWAQRRIETGAKGDTLMATVAAQFRALLLKIREMMERTLVLNGYDDTVLRDFRKFLDQGTKWASQKTASTGGRTAPAYSRRGDKLAGNWAVVASDPASFRYASSSATDPQTIASDMAPAGVSVTARIGESGGRKFIFFSATHQGLDFPAKLHLDQARDGTNDWQIESISSRPHGALLYQMAFTWAHNNGQVVNGGVLTPVNVLRRTSNMLSSALRHNTTTHMEPSPEQETDWQTGDHSGNIAALARKEADLVLQKLPGAINWRYDLDSGRIVNRDGVEIQPSEVDELTRQAGGSQEHGIGPATLARALLSRELNGKDAAAVSAALASHTGQESKTPRVLYRRRTVSHAGPEFDAALKEFEQWERIRARHMEENDRVPSHVLTALADAREVLEESWPGWRQTAKERAAELDAATETAPEPEPGVTAEDDTRDIDPASTRAKISQVTAASFRPVNGVKEWLAAIAKLFTNFRSSIPELPGGAAGREFTQFRQGYRMMKAATAYVQREAEDRVAHVLQPITDLGPTAIAPNEYRRLRDVAAAIKQLNEQDAVANRTAIARLAAEQAALEGKLEGLPYHLFRKTVLFRDLWFRSKLLNSSGEPINLPGYLTRQEVEEELTRLHNAIEDSPHRAALEESLKRHYALVKQTRDDLLVRGYIIPEELRNPLYFPHLVLEKFSGRLQRVKLDTAEDFRAYLQQLTGSAKDIETDYLTAMYYHMGVVMVHNAHQDIVADNWQPYDQTAELMEELKEINEQRAQEGLGPLVLEQIIPRDSISYTVDDRIPLRPEYVINRGVLAELLGVELGEGDLQAQIREAGLELTLTADDLQKAMAAGEKTKWIVPRPVAAALDAIVERETKSRALLQRALAKPQGWWKWYKLYGPFSFIRYSYGNLVADVEKLFSADPAVFKQLLPAYREVKAFIQGGSGTPLLREAFKRGVISTVTAGEVGELKQADRFEHYLTSWEKFRGSLHRGIQWGAKVNELREAAFRYAKFQVDVARMQRGDAPVYAGAYSRDVEAITDSKPGANDAIYAKAAQISRKTFVDYDDISVSGDTLRKYWIPFYSWMEGNFRYHANLFRNLGDMSAGARAGMLARGGLVAASKVVVPRSVAGVLLRLAMPYAAMAIWNSTGDRDELEKTLSEEDRRRFHIILGKDPRGKTIVVYGPTALSDVAEWFGGNEFARLATEYTRGRITLNQLAHDWISNAPKATLNKAVQGLNPFFKTMLEVAARKSFFPDFTDARSIADHDLSWHVLGSMTDQPTEALIRHVMDKDNYSTKDGWEWARQLILQQRLRDPEQWGYHATLDRVETWQKAHGGVVDFGTNNRADAKLLSSFRRAIRAADVPAAIQFYHKLLAAGYTAERFTASVRASDPLQTLKREHRQDFFTSLSPAEQEDVRNAYRYAQRMEAFKRHERQLFPSEKATAGYRERFAANPRDDVFAGIMFDTATRSDEDEELRAEKLLETALRPR